MNIYDCISPPAASLRCRLIWSTCRSLAACKPHEHPVLWNRPGDLEGRSSRQKRPRCCICMSGEPAVSYITLRAHPNSQQGCGFPSQGSPSATSTPLCTYTHTHTGDSCISHGCRHMNSQGRFFSWAFLALGRDGNDQERQRCSGGTRMLSTRMPTPPRRRKLILHPVMDLLP